MLGLNALRSPQAAVSQLDFRAKTALVCVMHKTRQKIRFLRFAALWVALAGLPWLVAACASMVSKTVYQEYQGSEGMMIGKGGTVRHVSGVDVWQIGEPNREYKIIGVIHDTTLNNQGAAPGTLNILNVASMVALSQREKRIANEAQKRGGDAVVYISGNREFQSQTLCETTHSENQLFAVV